jgi:hypothetical protein
MKALSAAVFVALIWAFCDAGAAEIAEKDYGRITWTGGGAIHVQGKQGRHVLIPVRVCDWCKTGTRVSITFSGLGKATLMSDSNSVRGGPVEALVLTNATDSR